MLLGFSRRFVNIVPGDAYRALTRGKNAADDLHGGRFAGAVWAKKTENFSTVNIETHVFYGTLLSIKARELLNGYKNFVFHCGAIILITSQLASFFIQR